MSKSSTEGFTPKKLSKSDVAQVWKLLSSRDLTLIHQGIKLVVGLEENWDELLAGVNIEPETGILDRGSRFSGSGSAQRWLDIALLKLLAIAPMGTRAARLRDEVRVLDFVALEFPSLAGFKSLKTLHIKLEEGFSAANLTGFEKLDNLETLIIEPEMSYVNPNVSLISLDGLYAPILEEIRIVNVNLDNIDALYPCVRLKKADFTRAYSLSSIAALSTSVPTLSELVLEFCRSLQSIDSISEANLTRLNLMDCSNIKSIPKFTNSVVFEELYLSGCEALESIAVLEGKIVRTTPHGPGSKEFSLSGCLNLKSLNGFPQLDPLIERLVLDGTGLTSLKGVEGATSITEVSIHATPVSDISSLGKLTKLEVVSLSESAALSDASVLGVLSELKDVRLSDCISLERLPQTWCSSLKFLDITGCANLVSLGVLPQSLQNLAGRFSRGKLDLSGWSKLLDIVAIADTELREVKTVNLSGCLGLSSLCGLDDFLHLSMITIPFCLSDGSALSHCSGLSVVIEGEGIKALPEALGRALSLIPNSNLKVLNANSLVDCSALSAVTGVASIDLTAVPKLRDLSWIVSCERLQNLILSDLSPAAKIAKASIFNTAAKVRKLKELVRIESESVLQPVIKKIDKIKAATSHPSIFIVKDLKAAVASGSIIELRVALASLAAESDAGIFDELVVGADPDIAFSGNNGALGKIFKDVKASNRSLARLAFASILGLAPEKAALAIKIRSEVKKIDIDFPESATVEDVPNLNEFWELTSLKLRGLPSQNMNFCRDLRNLKEIDIKEAVEIVSLEGLEGSSQLVSLSLWRCSKLANVSALREMNFLCSVDLGITSPIEDLSFVSGLKSISELGLNVAPNASFSMFEFAPWIKKLRVKIRGKCPDLRPLQKLEELHLEFSEESFVDEEASFSDRKIDWDLNFPSLKVLGLSGGVNDFRHIKAPKLASIFISGHFFFEHAFVGLGMVKNISILAGRFRAESLNGLQGSVIDGLRLADFESGLKDLSAIALMPRLRVLSLPTLDKNVLETVKSAPQVEMLDCCGFEGSLDWIHCFPGVRKLELQDSGELIELEASAHLQHLEAILLRNSKTKREMWPESVRAKLDYRR